jgi:hypothetical protein
MDKFFKHSASTKNNEPSDEEEEFKKSTKSNDNSNEEEEFKKSTKSNDPSDEEEEFKKSTKSNDPSDEEEFFEFKKSTRNKRPPPNQKHREQPQPLPQQQNDENVDYDEFRNAHRRCDYIPSNKINLAFSHNFPNSSIICDVNEDIKMCNVKISSLLNADIINWQFNREPDVVRIPKISRYIYESRTRLQTIFYLNYNFKCDKFEIIDGTHRYCALKMLKSLHDEGGIIIEELLRNDDGHHVAHWFNCEENIDWLLNSYVIVQINFKSTKNELIILRNDINHSQPMPVEIQEILQDVEKNGIINQIANEYIHRYKKSFADSNNETYLRSNRRTNRDNFVVLLSKIYDKYNININRVGTLQQKLKDANDKIRNKLLENNIKCNETIKTRCRDNGCYLFLYKNCELEELI